MVQFTQHAMRKEFPAERKPSRTPITLRREWVKEYFPQSEARDVSRGIPRPRGELSRLNRGGFSLKVVLGWDKSFIQVVQMYIREQVRSHLDITQPFKKQAKEKLKAVYDAITTKFPIFHQYENNWAAIAFVQAALKNSPRNRALDLSSK